MGLIFNGNGDVIKAVDGSLTVEGLDFEGGGNVNAGIGTFSDLKVTGTLTYEDVKNVDSVGIISARQSIHVGYGVSAAGIITATSYRGDGSQLTGITQVGGATTVGFDDNKPIYFGSEDDYKIYWNGTRMYFEPTSSSTTQQLEIVSNDQMYINSKDNGLFLKSADQNVIDIYGGSGGGIYFKHNGTQKLKLEGGNWTYLNSATVTHAGDVSIPDSIIHVGDTNTKIRFPADDTFSVETAGSERLRIDSSGKMGLGTNNPNNPLTIHASGNHIYLKDTATNNVLQIRHASGVAEFNSYDLDGNARRDYVFNQYSSEVLRIDSSGNIGAGTNSPSSFSASDFVISKSANAGMTISVGNAGTTNTASIFFAEGTGGTGDKERGAIKYKHGDDYLAFHTNYDERLRITSTGQMGLGVTPNWGNSAYNGLHVHSSGSTNAYVTLTNNATGSTSSSDGFSLAYSSTDINFLNRETGTFMFTSGGTERLRIDNNGRMKINHTNTSGQLDDTFLSIYDANSQSGISRNYAMITLHNYGTGSPGDVSGIGFGAGASFAYTKGSIGFERTDGYGRGALVFCTNNDGDTTLVNNTDERMRITQTGSIGVNETSPSFSGFGSNGGGIELDDVNSGFTALKVSHGAADMYLASAGSAAFISTRTNHDIIVEKNSAEVARFTANGLKVPSGKGIDFSSTSDASTGGSGSVSSEILDDYEYGTFTPDLTRWTGSAWWGATWTTAPTYALGRYVKVGKLVTVTMRISGWELNSSSHGRYAGIQGLPFTAGNSDPVGNLVCMYSLGAFDTDTATSFWIQAGDTKATSNRFGDDNGSHNVWSSGSNKSIVITGSYMST